MKKLLSIILCVALALCLSAVAFAGGDDTTTTTPPTTTETPETTVPASSSEIENPVATGGQMGEVLSSNSQLVPEQPAPEATAEEKLAEALKEIEELKKAQADLEAAKAVLEAEKKALEADKADLVTDRDAAKAEVAELEGKVADLEKQIDELEDKNAALQAELDKPHECTYQVVMWVLVAVVGAAIVAGVVLFIVKKKK